VTDFDARSAPLRRKVAIDASQAWFWSMRWQKMERQADDIAEGELRPSDTADEFLDELDAE
jgi:antitoxin MazE